MSLPSTGGDGSDHPGIDTIVALGTPAGRGALAVIRLSGPMALTILDRLCPGAPAFEPRRATLVRVRDPRDGSVLDRGLVTAFPAPDSYTGEAMAEISCHGGWMAPALVLEACCAAGARPAEPGEFTRRAYLNGKLDLVQAEAVADLVDGRSRALHDAALHQLERGLSERIGALRERLVELEALLAHHLDFPEEDDPPVPVERVAREAERVEDALEGLLATAPEGELLREGALTVLAGRPNTGKSSLFNALLGTERAIVTEVPGTTRDALEAVVSIGGYPFRLVDTAGLRSEAGRVERLGIEVARRYLGAADLVLYCADAAEPLSKEDRAFLGSLSGVPVILLRTRVDRLEAGSPMAAEEVGRASEDVEVGAGRGAPDTGAPAPAVTDTLRVSVVDGRGLGQLGELLPRLVYRGLVEGSPEAPVLTRARQTERIRVALGEVRGFRQALGNGVPPEVAATHLRPAETALEEVLGVISVDDVLDRLFARFCIGK